MALTTMLPDVQVADPLQSGGLQVFPLSWQPGEPLSYLTLEEALEGGVIEVGEISEGGSVPRLRLTNNSKLPVFLMAGEHLSGGKQNRVLNASLLAAAESSLPIPVSCVERGRWGYRSARFEGSGSSSHAALRKLMHSHTTRGYRSEGTPTTDQGEVWREVDRKLMESGSMSDTAYLHKAYEDTAEKLAPVLEALTTPEGAHGAVFVYGGKVVGMDLFDRPETLARLWPKLIKAYATDALVAPESAPLDVDAVKQWLATATTCQEESFPSVGLGEDVRLEGPALEAACLRLEGHPIHVEAFSK